MDKEIAAIVTKTGLPWFRYVSFANRPIRERLGVDAGSGGGLSLAAPAGALRAEPPAAPARAERPESSALEAPAAAASFFGPRPDTERPLTRNEDAVAVPPASLAEASEEATAGADFLLLRAVDELRQAYVDGRGHRADPSDGHGGPRSLLDPWKRVAEPSRAGFDLSG